MSKFWPSVLLVVHVIKIDNNQLSATALMLKYTGLYLKYFRVKIFVNVAYCTQRIITRPTFMNQGSFQRLFCVYLCVSADNKNIFAVAVDGFGLGKCHPHVSGSSLVMKFEPLCVTFSSLLQFEFHRNYKFMRLESLSVSNILIIRSLNYNFAIIIIVI